MGDRCDSVHVICNAVASSLGGEFACGGLGELFYDKWAKFGESLVALGSGFPFSDGKVKGAGAFDSGFDECKVTAQIHRNADLLELLFDLVITFKLGDRVFSWTPSIVHGANEFLDVDVIQSSTIGAEVVEDFNGCAVSKTQAFTAQACEPFGINGLNDFCSGGLEASLVCFVLDDALFVFWELA